MSMIEEIKQLLRHDAELADLWRDFSILPGTEGEKMLALRTLRAQAAAVVERHDAEIAAIQAKRANAARFIQHVEHLAERQLRSLRGLDTETFKLALGDGSEVVLRVRHSEQCIVDPNVVDLLPDDLVKTERKPKLKLIGAMLKLNQKFPGSEGCRFQPEVHEQVEGLK